MALNSFWICWFYYPRLSLYCTFSNLHNDKISSSLTHLFLTKISDTKDMYKYKMYINQKFLIMYYISSRVPTVLSAFCIDYIKLYLENILYRKMPAKLILLISSDIPVFLRFESIRLDHKLLHLSPFFCKKSLLNISVNRVGGRKVKVRT